MGIICSSPLLSYSLPFFHKRPWPPGCFFTHLDIHSLSYKFLILLLGGGGKNHSEPEGPFPRRGRNVMKLVFARYFYHRLGDTNRKELVSWRVTLALGFTDQSQPNSFSNLKIYIMARFIYVRLGPRPLPPRSAVISCGVTTIEFFTFPEKLPRLPCPQGSPAVPRGLSPSGKAEKAGRGTATRREGGRRTNHPGPSSRPRYSTEKWNIPLLPPAKRSWGEPFDLV